MQYEDANSGDAYSHSEDMDRRIRRLTAEGFRVKFNQYISTGWEIFKKDPTNFVLFSLLMMIAGGIAGYIFSFIPFLGNLVVVALTAPLQIGVAEVGHRIHYGKEYEFNDFFIGFERFQALALAAVLVSVLTSIGMILCIIPGIYLSVAYVFTYYIIWFGRKDDFWEAMESSRKLITEEWFNVFGLVVLLFLIILAGVVALGVGLFISLPVASISLYAAFDDIVGTGEERENSTGESYPPPM